MLPQTERQNPGTASRGPARLWAWAAALALGILPLWAAHHLPLVDLPQHLHLISVLHRLDDPTTLYPLLFEARHELTPYLGYYYVVSLLNWLLPLEVANKVFLSAYVVGLPLGLAFLLRSLGRQTWPALLALPFAYGDSFAWGFINYCAALPLTLLAAGAFVRAITCRPHRLRWGIVLALSLTAVLLMHVQAFAFLGIALPFLLLTTRAPEDGAAEGRKGDDAFDRWVRPRLSALLGVVPGVLLFIAWFGGRLGQKVEIAPGQPWKAWGPMFSPQNLGWKGPVQSPAPFQEVLWSHVRQNARELPEVLANMLRDHGDRAVLFAVALVAFVALVLATAFRKTRGAPERREGPVERWRMLGLGVIALSMFFLLPFDIRGYVYYLNTRYAHLALPLLLGALPAVGLRLRTPLLLAGAACSLVLALPLARGFQHFDEEASGLDRLAQLAAEKPRAMGLIYDPGSRVMTHPVFLHSAAVIARLKGGVANFSFATTPHSPLRYRGDPPPTFPSEWNPRPFTLERYGYAYDHFLVRGADPRQTGLAPGIGTQIEVVGREGPFFLLRRSAATGYRDEARSTVSRSGMPSRAP